MKPRETVSVSVAGHEIKLEVEAQEKNHVERAATSVNDRIHKLNGKAGVASPAKVAAMVAFQFACDLSMANEMLDEAEKVHAELARQKEAVKRLEGLLAKVDTALAY